LAATYLDRILARHREVEAADERVVEVLAAQAAAMPPVRDFRAALAGRDRLSVISEVKRRSPSKGDLAIDLDPADLARQYASGGASCLSVLTDVEFFGGSADDLRAARGACELPVQGLHDRRT
jgi:indole-3-glycerol phosphate synthase